MYVTPNRVRHHLRLEGAVLHPGHNECGLPGGPLGFLVTHLGGKDSVRQIQIQHTANTNTAHSKYKYSTQQIQIRERQKSGEIKLPTPQIREIIRTDVDKLTISGRLGIGPLVDLGPGLAKFMACLVVED